MEPEIAALFPDSFAASELGPIPAGWVVKPLGALVELAYGKGLKADQRQTGSVPVPGLNRNLAYLNKQVTPPISLVACFGEQVQSLFTRRHGLEEESRTLASLRDALLPKLVSGELRIEAPQGFSTEFHDG